MRRLVEAHALDDVGITDGRRPQDLVAHHVLDGRHESHRRRTGRSAETRSPPTATCGATWSRKAGPPRTSPSASASRPGRTAPPPRPPGRGPPPAPPGSRHGPRPAPRRGHPRHPRAPWPAPDRLCRLRLCDVDLEARTMDVWGKGDKLGRMPVPPALRRPAGRVRRGPSPVAPLRGHVAPQRRGPPPPPAGRHPPARSGSGPPPHRGVFQRLRDAAPELFADGDLSLHSYRHALGTYVDHHHGRAVTRAVLGHTSPPHPNGLLRPRHPRAGRRGRRRVRTACARGGEVTCLRDAAHATRRHIAEESARARLSFIGSSTRGDPYLRLRDARPDSGHATNAPSRTIITSDVEPARFGCGVEADELAGSVTGSGHGERRAPDNTIDASDPAVVALAWTRPRPVSRAAADSTAGGRQDQACGRKCAPELRRRRARRAPGVSAAPGHRGEGRPVPLHPLIHPHRPHERTSERSTRRGRRIM